MWWLNAGSRFYSQASEQAFAAQGAGGNVVAVCPEHRLVVVTRWAGDADGVIDRVIKAIR